MRTMRWTAAALLLGLVGPAWAQTTPNPVMFVTQYPVPYDFAAIGSVFANHQGDVDETGRGGDLYIRYPNGTLRNLTSEAGFGMADGLQTANSIAVRDPAVHWSGTKAVFSMVIGAPAQQYQTGSYYFQLYEVTGLGAGQTAIVTKVPNQPANYNNVQPTYASDGSIIFVTDRPRSGERHLYPQHDEYESTTTPTGLWKLNPQTGELVLLQHSPSGSFTPIVDSYGRVIFTRWDHMQRDQQNESSTNEYGTFNYTSEAANSTATPDRSEVYPEPRIAAQGSPLEGFTINHFFPWMINQDGTAEETINHVGRHELHSYFNRAMNTDGNLVEFIASNSGRPNQNSVLNVLQLREDPTQAGRYIAIDSPEFDTHASGQLIRFTAPPNANPANVTIEYLTHRDTFGTNPSANHTGHYRNPVVLSNGTLVVAHTTQQGGAGNDGTREAPIPRYNFRLKFTTAGGGGFLAPGATLLPGAGIVRNIRYWDPDYQVVYNGPMWELSPVEVVARAAPPSTTETIAAPEQQAFTLENVSPAAFRAWLRQNNLAVLVVRNATTRDVLDRQQPFNLRVPGGAQTIGTGGTVYDVAYMQMFQGDQIRGRGGMSDPAAGRRVLAQLMHDSAVVPHNPPNLGPPASAPIKSDGSVALFVPTRRALTWQTTTAGGTPVVRERYWITAQPGEIRACDGCHGVNQQSQSGATAAVNTPTAFREMLATWRDTLGIVFSDGFE